MPNEALRFKPREELLSFEEITRFVRIVAQQGIDKVRLTGGEPLVRAELPELVKQLRSIREIHDLALTTNGILLTEQATALRQAGVQRLNISLDALSEATFVEIARRTGLQRVLDGIDAAIDARFDKIRLNAVSIRGLTEDEIVPLASFARRKKLELRFIEYMPLDAEGRWDHEQVLGGDEVRAMLVREFGPLTAVARTDTSQPAVDYQYNDLPLRVGFINPVTQSFCGECNRLRLTAEGQVRNCLFSTVEWDARALLRGIATDEDIASLVTDCVQHKKFGHGIDTPEFVKPERAMYQIGG